MEAIEAGEGGSDLVQVARRGRDATLEAQKQLSDSIDETRTEMIRSFTLSGNPDLLLRFGRALQQAREDEDATQCFYWFSTTCNFYRRPNGLHFPLRAFSK